MTFYFTSIDVESSAPESHGLDAIEIWMIACNLMIFAALSEYGLVLFIMFKKTKVIGKKNKKRRQCNRVGGNSVDGGKNNVDEGSVTERKIDLISLILFPIAFSIFISIYCLTYK